ncbi:MAG: hypothetical protein IJB47_00595 [Oscillospiraceae bacterium]|nr:hypothetical protein [Oscillospiraceae bacterium]
MKLKIPLSHLIFLAICIALSLVTKRVISPITNLLTDFLRVPGGGAATAFSLMFLVIATSSIQWPLATAAAGFVQSLLALSMGMGAYQGAFAILTYTLPGLVIDLFRKFYPRRDNAYFSLSCGAANTTGALLTNLLVFRLEGISFLLWMLIACVIGLLGGLLGGLLFHRIERIPEFRRFVLCQEK